MLRVKMDILENPFDEVTSDLESIIVSKKDDSINEASCSDKSEVCSKQCDEDIDEEIDEETSDNDEEEHQENIEETPAIEENHNDVSNLEKFEELNGITPKMIEILKIKLNKYRGYKEMFESIDKINLETNIDELPTINDKTLTINTTNDKLNASLIKELKQTKQLLATRTKQLEKATELLAMMRKGLNDRGQYIKMLIDDNRRLREEVKYAIVERKTLCEKFANDFEDLPPEFSVGKSDEE
ncbi:hypothetical protein O3M35_011073 [Rhynocoris fuscipes]|uniref:Uncharacterized protein n=1 Tax=Rhynocoris fuscipes TaxID=488301 RepID=A0AAW1CX68_9HEMI